MKSYWDELGNFRPIPHCACGTDCGALKAIVNFQEFDYVMHFFMGLNESFSHVRGQILLSDPLQPNNKVFSLVLQEERQREISSAQNPSLDSTALLA